MLANAGPAACCAALHGSMQVAARLGRTDRHSHAAMHHARIEQDGYHSRVAVHGRHGCGFERARELPSGRGCGIRRQLLAAGPEAVRACCHEFRAAAYMHTCLRVVQCAQVCPPQPAQPACNKGLGLRAFCSMLELQFISHQQRHATRTRIGPAFCGPPAVALAALHHNTSPSLSLPSYA